MLATILTNWAGQVSDGMLPNRFPDDGQGSQVQLVDASLWFIIAVHDLFQAAQKKLNSTYHPKHASYSVQLSQKSSMAIRGAGGMAPRWIRRMALLRRGNGITAYMDGSSASGAIAGRQPGPQHSWRGREQATYSAGTAHPYSPHAARLALPSVVAGRVSPAETPNPTNPSMSTLREQERIAAANARTADWKRWGPYLSERQWATVREDYSEWGNCWDFLMITPEAAPIAGVKMDCLASQITSAGSVLHWPCGMKRIPFSRNACLD